MNLIHRPATSFYQSQHAPYYIVSPNFSQKSSGPRMLHYLCHILNELGYEAYITAPVSSPWLRTPELTQDIRRKHKETGRTPIAVYPEVAHGNPLQAPVIARWILNKAGHLGGPREFHSDELLFYWDEWVLQGEQNADRLFLPSVDDRIFNDHGSRPDKRTGFCYYAHKYLIFGGRIADSIARNGISLCQDIPRTAEEIADILRTARVLYCYEPSNIVAEAYACGCPAILVQTDYLKQFDLSRLQIPKIPEADIDFSFIPPISDALKDAMEADKAKSWDTLWRFIEKTQAAVQAYDAHAAQPQQKLQAALRAFHAGDAQTAFDTLVPLLDAMPDDPLPPAYLAFLSAAQGLPDAAQEFIARALQIAPHRADLKAALGESFLKAGQPELAAAYLEEALQQQPDMLSAYPALARSLHLIQQSDKALALLQGAAHMPGPAQAHIHTTLLELLAEQGDIAAFAAACLRHAQGLADDLLAARCLARCDASGAGLVEALSAAQARLAACLPETPPAPVASQATPPWKIAFMTSDFAREAQLGRLKALLAHLPPTHFITTLIVADAQSRQHPFAQTCALIADRTLDIAGLDDAAALACLDADPADILIDLDCYGPTERLALFLQARAGLKLLWGEAPMPSLAPDCLTLQGEALADTALLPGVLLPGLGEYGELPDLPIVPASAAAPTLACLSPAMRIGADGWQLFAQVLRANPESQLLLNLKDLGASARAYITRQFTQAGIAASRLRFVHARTAEELCHYWQAAHLGLAPPVDAGDQALSTCLWMGRPFVALAAQLPWSRRPAALLECAGAADWVAADTAHYIALASRPPHAPDPGLRQRLSATGYTDAAAFAQGFAATMTRLVQAATAASSPAL
ncbi:MAG: hypothetical protein N3C59_09775 [Azovibrio sp.]|nr:hypothetical protein [Azovibrio sp.]